MPSCLAHINQLAAGSFSASRSVLVRAKFSGPWEPWRPEPPLIPEVTDSKAVDGGKDSPLDCDGWTRRILMEK